MFKSTKFLSFYEKYNITMGHSTTYHPKGNGLDESSNKTLLRIMKNTHKKIKRIGTHI